MSEPVESNLYLQLSDEQKEMIVGDDNYTNEGERHYGIVFEKHGPFNRDNLEKKYAFMYNNILNIETDCDRCCSNWLMRENYYTFYMGQNPETTIQSLESINIDQLFDDRIEYVEVSVSGYRGTFYEECVFRYDYDNEKWLTEPLMYDDDDYSVCKGMIN